jgi:hypothetical protein
MLTVHGRTPAGREDRDMDIWLADDGSLHVWIHAPGSDRNAGWEIRVEREQIAETLRQLRLLS